MERMGLGSLIREARLRRGWTQDDLAQRLGVERSYVSQWETSGRRWPREHVRAIADALDLSQVDMAVAAGLIDPPVNRPAPEIRDYRLTQLVASWPRLKPEVQATMHDWTTKAAFYVEEEPEAVALAR